MTKKQKNVTTENLNMTEWTSHVFSLSTHKNGLKSQFKIKISYWITTYK